MYKPIASRLISIVPVLFVVSIVVFSLLYLTPGDPAHVIAGPNATAADVEKIREALGLNDSFLVRYASWLGDIARLDFGNSIMNGTPVVELIAQRIEPTLSLMFLTIILAVVVAVPMGVLAAAKVNTIADRLVMLFAISAFSVPVFIIGYVLARYFALELRWFPVQGYAYLADGVLPWLRHLVLPSVALGLVYIALIARITRAAMLEVLSEDYIRTARAKGLRSKRILFLHALRNASNPIVTVIGVGVALLIGGAVVTESVFGIPGLGRLTIDAILRRDYPVIQGIMLLFSFVYVLVNLLIDICYVVLDPRIRY
ncbi:ABC transporter permease [Arvimicrobium flavum]|uniref:ABC transporter permease n=1 Tax=Arvimicrobium flavum TaxID=3393320 RepID=UPI00237C0044|nr:ABC transporter permease [Mesorhizobium shangrilense]